MKFLIRLSNSPFYFVFFSRLEISLELKTNKYMDIESSSALVNANVDMESGVLSKIVVNSSHSINISVDDHVNHVQSPPLLHDI